MIVSELRSAIEGLRAESLPELPDARIEEDFAELQRASEQLEAERLRRLAEIDRRGLYARDGHLSVASWLVGVHRVAWGTAREQVRLARGLEAMPATRRALEAGELSMSGARSLVAAREADPEAFERCRAGPRRGRPRAQRRPSCSGSSPSGGSGWSASEDPRGLTPGTSAGACTPRSRSAGWCGWTPTWIPETGEHLLIALRAVLDAEVRSGTDGRGRAGGPHPGAAPGRRPGGDLPPVAGRAGATGGRGRTAPPDARRWAWRGSSGTGTGELDHDRSRAI